ncbi:MAG: TIGR01459 family HAD-type hydrolase [Alphaproteobacteria bacterium]|nr:TIGR01459 family HAD-type hydrolase [Alphaproteobacteria bacterium]
MIPILDRAGALLARYDVLFCDVWGVVHDGVRAHDDAVDALGRFRAGGGTVVMVSNAPIPGSAVARVMDEKAVPRGAWDAVVASGDLAREAVAARGWRSVHHVGPARDLALFRHAGVARVALAEADGVVCTGLVDDRAETAADYDPLLAAIRARDLVFVCANPDLVVEVGDALLPCAGAIAQRYEAAGGEVVWAGKPHAPAYAAATARAAALRQHAIDRGRVLAIGDSVRTDLAGAAAWGIDALFVAHGIHRARVMPDGRLDPGRLADLLAEHGATATAAVAGLAW